jgi:hypothetical protein
MTASLKRTLGWITTPFFLLAFGLLLLAFDPLQRLALLFGALICATRVRALEARYGRLE